MVTRPAVSLAQDRECSLARTGGLTTMLHHHWFHAISEATLQSLNSPTFPGISHRGINIYLTTSGIQTGLRILLSEYCGILLAVHLVQVNFTEHYSDYVYFVTIATVVKHHN